jgi:hypothetical protein
MDDPSPLDDAANTIGPIRTPANRSMDASGSIHDDATAQRLGFRGGTVAGNVHLDQFPPLLVDAYGQRWFERGTLSMYFRAPTTDREPVIAVHNRVSDAAFIVTPTGSVVAEGEAGVDIAAGTTQLRRRDRRPTEPSTLTLLHDVRLGTDIDAGPTSVDHGRQMALLAGPDLLTEPLDWYRDASPWGPPIACPSVAVDTLWAPFEQRLRGTVGRAVGLYGAIELAFHRGPLVVGADYALHGRIVAVSDSPRTEIFWAETEASDERGPVATLLMMIRLLKPQGA